MSVLDTPKQLAEQLLLEMRDVGYGPSGAPDTL